MHPTRLIDQSRLGRGVVIVNKAMVMVTSFRRCCS